MKGTCYLLPNWNTVYLRQVFPSGNVGSFGSSSRSAAHILSCCILLPQAHTTLHMTTAAQGSLVLQSVSRSRDSVVTANNLWLQATSTGSGSAAREPLWELPAQQQQDPAQVTLLACKAFLTPITGRTCCLLLVLHLDIPAIHTCYDIPTTQMQCHAWPPSNAALRSHIQHRSVHIYGQYGVANMSCDLVEATALVESPDQACMLHLNPCVMHSPVNAAIA